jgi:hypothetical protein
MGTAALGLSCLISCSGSSLFCPCVHCELRSPGHTVWRSRSWVRNHRQGTFTDSGSRTRCSPASTSTWHDKRGRIQFETQTRKRRPGVCGSTVLCSPSLLAALVLGAAGVKKIRCAAWVSRFRARSSELLCLRFRADTLS